jgi:hypothetical protein
MCQLRTWNTTVAVWATQFEVVTCSDLVHRNEQ